MVLLKVKKKNKYHFNRVAVIVQLTVYLNLHKVQTFYHFWHYCFKYCFMPKLKRGISSFCYFTPGWIPYSPNWSDQNLLFVSHGDALPLTFAVWATLALIQYIWCPLIQFSIKDYLSNLVILLWMHSYNLFKNAFKKCLNFRAPEWFSGLSLCLRLRSWSQDPGIKPCIGLSA